jgi:hypothetical protein
MNDMIKSLDKINESISVEKPKKAKRNVTEEEKIKLQARAVKMREAKNAKRQDKEEKQIPNTYHGSLKTELMKVNNLDTQMKFINDKLEKIMESNEKNNKTIKVKEELEIEKISYKKLEEDMARQKKEDEERIIQQQLEKNINKEKEEKKFFSNYNVQKDDLHKLPPKNIKYNKLPYNIKTVSMRLRNKV